MVVVAAMGEVEAGHIHAEQQQLTNLLLAARGWTEGADDLGAAPKSGAGGCSAAGKDDFRFRFMFGWIPFPGGYFCSRLEKVPNRYRG